MENIEKCGTCRCNKICDHNKYGFENCGNYISADVVEVVRCKDCLKYEADVINPDVGWCEEFEKSVFEECFCSYGERKE